MAARRTHSRWLEAYLKFVENSESPQSYHRWAGISLVAGALQRRVYMMRGGFPVYPNMYIVLIGPSGISRKGEPIKTARWFMERTPIVSLGVSNSKESIVRDMHNSAQNYTDPNTGKVHTHCSVTAMSEELSVFTGSQDVGMISYLTDWYDSADKWKRSTKHQGIDEVDGVCFNFLSAADPSWLPNVLPQEAVGGGLMSRIIFVVEDRKKRSIPNPGPLNERLRETLAADLEIMMTLIGEFKFDRAAQALHDQWYLAHDLDYEHGDPLMRGYGGRRENHLRKISMILSACRSNDLIVTEEDFSTAITYLSSLEPKMPEVYGGMVSTKYGKEGGMVMSFLRGRRSASRAEIMNAFSYHIDAEIFEAVTKDLVARKLVQEIIAPGKDIVLRIIDQGYRDRPASEPPEGAER